MPRFRTTIINIEDRKEQLRYALRVQQEFIDQLPVQLDPEHPLRGIHRDEQCRAYFELATANLDQVREFLHDREYEGNTELSTPTEPPGDPCSNCGNIAGPTLPTVCPNCGFRDISRCPICGEEVPRQNYAKLSGKVFLCPTRQDGARHRVRLSFNEPMLNTDGTYREPLVVVNGAEER